MNLRDPAISATLGFFVGFLLTGFIGVLDRRSRNKQEEKARKQRKLDAGMRRWLREQETRERMLELIDEVRELAEKGDTQGIERLRARIEAGT